MIERPQVRVDDDFASTLCYVGYRVMARMQVELDALALELTWTPLDLVGITDWPRAAASEALGERTREARAAEVIGVPTFMLGRWPFGGIQEECIMRSLLTRWAEKQRA
jgi:predicted DsbA family dithiol-disulfide isomerase